MFLYHGTSWENYVSIRNIGFGGGRQNWTCSDPDVTYFYNPMSYSWDWHTGQTHALRDAFGSAQVAAALTLSEARCVVVIEYNARWDEILIDDTPNSPEESVCIAHPVNERVTSVYIMPWSFWHAPAVLSDLVLDVNLNTERLGDDLILLSSLISGVRFPYLDAFNWSQVDDLL